MIRSYQHLTITLFLISSLFWTFSALSTEPLRISVSLTPLSLPFYVADSQGYFADEGVELKINDVIGGNRTMQQLCDGEADLATSSEAVVMFHSFKHDDFAVIASFVSSTDDVKIITHSDSGISHPKQLAGKRIGTVSGSASHYYLQTTLLFNGIDSKEVQVLDLQPENMSNALKNKELDAVAIWEPYPFMALKDVQDTKMLNSSNIYRLTFNLIVHKKQLGSRDDDLVKILRALDRAELFINSQPLKAKDILLTRLKLDTSFIDWIWPSYIFKLSLDQSLLTTLESEARWAREAKLVKEDVFPNYLNYIYIEPLSKVNSSAVSIIR